MELKKYRKQITTLKPSYYTQAFIVSVLSIFMDHATAQAVSLWPLAMENPGSCLGQFMLDLWWKK